MYELTQRDKDQILMRMRKAFLVITEAEDNYEELVDKSYGYMDIFNVQGYVSCSCKQGLGKKQYGVTAC